MCISLLLGLIAGIPFVDVKTADGKTVQGLANVIGAGFAGTFTSIGIVIILGHSSDRCLKKRELH